MAFDLSRLDPPTPPTPMPTPPKRPAFNLELLENPATEVARENESSQIQNTAENLGDVDSEDGENLEYTGLFCSECGEPQFDTPPGVTCANGHGGAEPVTGMEVLPRGHGYLDQRAALQAFVDEHKAAQAEQRRAKKADFNDRAKKWFKDHNYNATRADYFDHKNGISRDFLGIFDYVAFGDGETLGVQITDTGDVSKRRKKIMESVGYKWAKRAGWRVVILGFEARKRGCKVVELP